MNTSSERLKIARKKLGFSQVYFSEALGIKQGSYSDIERGKVKDISESLLLILDMKFGINPEWLKTGRGEMLDTALHGKLLSPDADNDCLSCKEKDKEIQRLKDELLETYRKLAAATEKTATAGASGVRVAKAG